MGNLWCKARLQNDSTKRLGYPTKLIMIGSKGFFEETKNNIESDEHFKQLVNELGEEINEEVQGMMLFEPNNPNE